jgi:hypothetical protein
MPESLYRFMCTSDDGDPTSWLVMAKDDGHAMDVGFKKYPDEIFQALNTMWGVDLESDHGAFWTTESVMDRLADEEREDACEDLAYQLSTVIGLEGLPDAYYEAMAKGLYQHLTRNRNQKTRR